jgi:hypothetical protein
VVRLVAVAQATQDLHGLIDRRLVHAHLLEAALERRIALEVLAVLVERRRADRLDLAACEGRLEDRSGVDRTLRGACADEVVELVDEQDDVSALGDLLHHLLQALLELTAVLRPGDESREVEGVDLLALEELRHLARGDAGCEALDDGRLADPGLADEHRVVLLPAREDLHHALDLRLAPDHRVELPFDSLLRQVAAELVEELRALRLLPGRSRAGLPASWSGEHPDDFITNLFRICIEVEQDAGGDSLVLADETEQDVLRADVVVPERQGLAQRQLQNLLGARRERDLAGGDLVSLADDARNLRTHLLDRDIERLENAGRESLLFTQETEQDVLGSDVVVLQRSRLVLRENDHLPCAFGESLEQFPSTLLPSLRPPEPTGLPTPGRRCL